jgi:hypothetical protein
LTGGSLSAKLAQILRKPPLKRMRARRIPEVTMPEVAAVLQACLTVALAILARVPFLATALSKVPNGFTVVPDTRTARERKMRDGEVKGGPASAYLAPQSKGKVGEEAGRYFALNGARVIHVDPRLAADPIRAVATILEAVTRHPDSRRSLSISTSSPRLPRG